MSGDMTSVTIILNAIESGTAQTEDLLPLVYEELRRLASAKMRNERADHTLQATALVHEAFLRLLGDGQLRGRVVSPWPRGRRDFEKTAETMTRNASRRGAKRDFSYARGRHWVKFTAAYQAASWQ